MGPFTGGRGAAKYQWWGHASRRAGGEERE